jgi:uncharacterized protein (DUF1786 family)
VVMDTAPAAVLGASFDPAIAACGRVLIANVGNFHTLAFRMRRGQIEGVFEHHTGLLNLPRLEHYLRSLADGTLQHADVFNDHGHGALVYDAAPLPLGRGAFDVAVTGPRRNMFRSDGSRAGEDAPQVGAALRPYFATPFGDMMIAGCFGLLAAVADLMPELGDGIHASLNGMGSAGIAPWDLD